MSIRSHQASPRWRWLVTAIALALAVGVPLVGRSIASAAPALPPVTAQELLTQVRQASPTPIQGNVSTTANLGLPSSLGSLGATGSGSVSLDDPLSVLSLTSGTHSWRVWADGAGSERVALVDPSSETDVVSTPTDTWLWSSSGSTALHVVHGPQPSSRPVSPSAGSSPTDVANHILAALDPSTEVSIDTNATVAGRATYTLVLTPRDTSSTRVAGVRISVDAQTKVPLAVQVRSTQANDPAMSVAFTSVSYDKPAASLFTFAPPAGAKITEVSAPEHSTSSGQAGATSPSGVQTPQVHGSGWSSVLVTTLPAQEDQAVRSAESSAEGQRILGALPEVSGSWGKGRLVSGTLFSAVLTDDGRLAVGAVAPGQLYAALG